MASLVVSACGINNTEENSDSGKLSIITTFYPMYDFTKNIVGEKANVELLIPSTIEPHDWEPTPKDIASIQNADLFVFNSSEMETWVSDIKSSINNDNVKFIEASTEITLKESTNEESHETEEDNHDESEHSHELDPHVWLSPVLAQKEVEAITKALVEIDPDNEEYYRTNSLAYIEKLQELDNRYKTELANRSTDEFITQHTAFSYLAGEYGLSQIAIAGLSPEEEPSASKLAELKSYAEEKELKVIYFEDLTSTKVAETLANELGIQTEVLYTLEGLSQEEQDEGKDYISVMEENLKQLKKSLF